MASPVRALAVPVAAAVVVLTAAAPAQARKLTYGSNLTAPATIARATPNDSVHFNDRLARGRGVKVRVKGQVIQVKIKGRIVPSPQTLSGGGNPFDVIHFQVLRPQGGGRWKVTRFGTSTDYHMPWAGSDNQITTFHTTNQNDALCVRPGDRVDFATLGGFDPANGYPNGTSFRTFARVRGSALLQYSAAGAEGVNNETTFKPQRRRRGQELLMQYVVGTGTHARPFCR
jgi:hypothetical protein